MYSINHYPQEGQKGGRERLLGRLRNAELLFAKPLSSRTRDHSLKLVEHQIKAQMKENSSLCSGDTTSQTHTTGSCGDRQHQQAQKGIREIHEKVHKQILKETGRMNALIFLYYTEG